ncbi:MULTISPECIES: hypothetical protein [unclassified Mesorhizobium]|uniref:hypothetical protein n=1 Tax=unclassified Mesorhizobium TaxID=325217 RepID=UPI000FCB82C3|nr:MULTISPECIES: hypothetical protein [unclassified Mesorhizobium]RUX97452.1 hypothetical protein EN993_03885 [Mesorhizobium sp. M7D.F.Ca.US.004.01.2.1]RVA36638.1 hypothetical protein EN935_01695 [Mesorhizobium sp. M7D.F.Ca.US.004.03.1.1]
MEFRVLSWVRGVLSTGKAKLVVDERRGLVELRSRIRGRMYRIPISQDQSKAIADAHKLFDKARKTARDERIYKAAEAALAPLEAE